MPVLDLNDTQKVDAYDKFIENSPYGHMMQARAWSEVKNNWAHDYVYTEDKSGEINGALSILSVKNDGVNAFMYAPRGPVCDPTDLERVNALLLEAQSVVEKNNGFLLRMDPEVMYTKELVDEYRANGYSMHPSDDDAAKGSYSNPPYNMILYLKDMGIEEVIASYKGKNRNLIRKTYKNGLYTELHDSTDEDFQQSLVNLNELLQLVANRQGIALRDLAYLERLSAAFTDVKIFETHHPDGELLSACMVISYNKKSFYIYAASGNTHRELHASMQMNQEAINYAIKRGSLEYDMGGVFSTDSSSDGLYCFKKQFVRKDDYTRFIGEIDTVYNDTLYQEFIER